MKTRSVFKSSYKLDKERARRIADKFEKIKGLRSLMATHDQCGNVDEVKRLIAKIRLVEQELLYMGGCPECRRTEPKPKGKQQQ